MTQINFHPPPGSEPRSLGTVSSCLIHYATVPHEVNSSCYLLNETFQIIFCKLEKGKFLPNQTISHRTLNIGESGF